MYTPEFGDKYKLEVIVSDNRENDAIKIIRENSKIGKIFILPVARYGHFLTPYEKKSMSITVYKRPWPFITVFFEIID